MLNNIVLTVFGSIDIPDRDAPTILKETCKKITIFFGRNYLTYQRLKSTINYVRRWSFKSHAFLSLMNQLNSKDLIV